ncbi:hypothetical protein FRC01_014415, partial [Tulasnella sp. 417]
AFQGQPPSPQIAEWNGASEQEPMMSGRTKAWSADEFTRLSKKFGITASRLTQAAVGGSTDFGNVTYEVPSLHPSYAIPTGPGGGNHTALFAKAAATKEAHSISLQVAKVLAITGARLLIDDKFMAEVKAAYEEGRTTGT